MSLPSFRSFRVLHIGNTAAVASTLARYMGDAVIARKRADPWGLTYFGRCLNDFRFFLSPLVYGSWYDVLHVHYDDMLLFTLGWRFRDKPFVMHYHGSDIRGRWGEKEKFWSRADAVLVSTPDLLDGAPDRAEAVYLPNPVDTKLFFDRGRHVEGTGLCFSYGADDLAWEYARVLGVDLEVRDRFSDPVSFPEMPGLLSGYEYYFDVRREDLWGFFSKTGLEALASGCKVVGWDGEVSVGLPPVHEPRYVSRRLSRIYEKLL